MARVGEVPAIVGSSGSGVDRLGIYSPLLLAEPVIVDAVLAGGGLQPVFTEHLPATFVYAGIDVERRLFTGVRGKQIAGRCVLINTGPFPCDADWKA